jgi:hypothetical protein
VSQPRHARQTTRGRTYSHPTTGETVWSVSTIIDAGVPKKALTYWAAREVAEAAVANHRVLTAMVDAVRILRSDDNRIRGIVSDPDAVEAAIDWLKGAPWRKKTRRANVGSAVHSWIEQHTLGKPLPPVEDLDVAPYQPAWLAFIADFKPEFLASEMSVWNRTESYGGTLDWIARIGGRVVIGDTKTGKDVYADVALQLAAYARAEFALMADGSEQPLPALDGAVVLHLRDDGTYRLLPVDVGDAVFKAFLFAREVMRWSEEVAGDVLGAQLAGPDGLAFLWPDAKPQPMPVKAARRRTRKAA